MLAFRLKIKLQVQPEHMEEVILAFRLKINLQAICLSTLISLPTMDDIPDLYRVLNVTRDASATQVKRAYRTLLSKAHPDKGGSPRKIYDETGKIFKGEDEEFLEAFASGSFKDPAAKFSEGERTGKLSEIILHAKASDKSSHTAGFEAWLRSRGGPGSVFNAESAADTFGVVKSSYNPVQLPNGETFKNWRETSSKMTCTASGRPTEVLSLDCVPSAAELEWGQVAVDIRYAPINPADIYSARLGGVYGSDCTAPPFVAGHDGVGIVSKPGDCVILNVASSLVGQPGDCVIFNAANSTVGQVLLQLCRLLKLRAVAVARDSGQAGWESMVSTLKALGATEVIKDEGSVELEQLKFFAKPKLALDAVGGESGLRIADALADTPGFHIADALAD
eukprot:gene4162-14262_t